MAQQLGKAVEAAIAPHQFALSTKAGCECIAHILQGLTDFDDRATVISVDGVSAFDLISRTAMMKGLFRVAGGSQALLFIRMFYGAPSEYLWEDSSGTVHTIPQGEGGLMPLLFAVGQHKALEAISDQLPEGDHLLAFLDDTYIVTQPERVSDAYRCLDTELWNRARIRIHGGKTKIWNRSGIRPPICDVLERIARASDPSAVVWRGSDLPLYQQGLKVLGSLLGHPAYVQKFLEKVTWKHQLLLDRIPLVQDLQCAWLPPKRGNSFGGAAGGRTGGFESGYCSPRLRTSFFALSARPLPRNQDDFEPRSRRPGWQYETSSRTEQQFRDLLFAARLSPSAKATIRSQGGAGAAMALVTCPTCRITTIPPQLFRVTLLRRLRVPLHLTVRSCRCGLPLDEFGHHRAACAQVGGVEQTRVEFGECGCPHMSRSGRQSLNEHLHTGT